LSSAYYDLFLHAPKKRSMSKDLPKDNPLQFLQSQCL